MGAARHVTLQALLEAAFHRAVPDGCDEDTRRRGRLVVIFAMVVVPAILVFTGFYLVRGLYLSATGTSLTFVLVGASMFVMRRHSVAAGVHTFMVGGVSGWMVILVAQGGIESPALGWFTLVPWAAMMLGGRAIGFFWIGIIVAILGLFTVLGMASCCRPARSRRTTSISSSCWPTRGSSPSRP